MPHRPLLACVLALVFVASACGGSTSSDETAAVATGDAISDTAPVTVSVPGPDGVLDTTAGSTFGFEDIVGEPTVLWFWGPG